MKMRGAARAIGTMMNWRPAATTILFNTKQRTVLLLRRGTTAKFMPNVFVFPGGVLDKTDRVFPQERTNFRAVSDSAKMEGFESDYSFRIAALRELFEETGILLVQNERKKKILTTTGDDSLKELRDKVKEKPELFREIFSDFKLDVESLIPWSNWLTPVTLSSRFDTLFFLIAVDSEIEVDLCNKEMSDWHWASPSDILKSENQGNVGPPQFYELFRLNNTPTESLTKMMVPARILPQIVTIDGSSRAGYSLLPGDYKYDESEDCEPMRTMSIEELNEWESTDSVVHRTSHGRSGDENYKLFFKNVERAPQKIRLFPAMTSHI